MTRHTHSALVFLLATACATVPPAKPAREDSNAPSPSFVASAAPDATPAGPEQKPELPASPPPSSASAPVASVDGPVAPTPQSSPQPPNQIQPTPTAAASSTKPPPFESKRPTFWFCYMWAHLRFTTQDCFDTLKECRANIPKGEGIVLRPCMAQKKPSWCTEPHDVSEDPKAARSEKCFGSADDCEQYRAYVQGNGLESTPCVEVATK